MILEVPGSYEDLVASARAGTLFPDSTVKMISEEAGDGARFEVTPQSEAFLNADGSRSSFVASISDDWSSGDTLVFCDPVILGAS